MATTLTRACDAGEVSDSYHTLDELYAHRCALFLALMRSNQHIAWRSRLHADGTGFPGWWIGGVELSTGPITYHLPDADWHLADEALTLDRAPEFDGHTADDVVRRLRDWAGRPTAAPDYDRKSVVARMRAALGLVGKVK